jgi:hypothetical protein
VKTIQIHLAKKESPRVLRSKLLRGAHLALAVLIGLSLPTLTIVGFFLGFHSHSLPLSEGWSTGLVTLTLLGLMLNSMASCEPKYLMIGMAGTGLSLLLPGEMRYALPVLGLSSIISLSIAHATYTTLRARTPKPEACATNDELNPKCSTCRVRSFCPYQPGGFADQYTPKA